MEMKIMNHFEGLSRRDFLKGAGSVGALGLLTATGGCETLIHDIENRPVRRNIANLSPSDPIVQTYQAAVSAMKALPISDPRNWTQQANIHFNHCPHSNWWFLPWHRAYLWYFERICQKLTGNNDFALPYWNWTTSPSIPSVFWGQGNPLLDTTRGRGPSDQADPSFVGPAVVNNILNQTNFFLFASGAATHQRDFSQYGMLEGTPHNYIHGWVSGDMGAFHSPLDPVFWCHHNMLDCLWTDWNIDRNNPNTNDPTWANLQFTDFVDENGNAVSFVTAAAPLLPFLFYRFEPCSPAEAKAQIVRDRTALQKFLREGAPVRLDFIQRLPLQQAVVGEAGRPPIGKIAVAPELLRSLLTTGANTAALLTIAGVNAPAENDFFVRVFLGKPDASADTPLDDAHYVGSFAFFSDTAPMPGMADHPKPGFVINATPTVRRLSQAGALPTDTQLSLVAVPFPGRKAAGQRITVERLELGIALL
jgi:tyrosinase